MRMYLRKYVLMLSTYFYEYDIATSYCHRIPSKQKKNKTMPCHA